MNIHHKPLLTSWLVWFAACAAAHATDHYGAVEKYLTDDIVAIGMIDLSRIEPVKAVEWIHELGLTDDEQHTGAIAFAKIAEQAIVQLQEAGGRHMYVLVDMAEITGKSLGVVIPVAEGGDPQGVAKTIKLGPGKDLLTHVGEQVVLAAGNERHLQKLRNAQPAIRNDFKLALESLEERSIGVALAAGRDQRRILREMFPQLPQPFEAIDGKLLADGIEWTTAQADLFPKPNLQITVQASSPDTASKLQHAATKGLALLKETPQARNTFTDTDRDDLFAALAPQVEGSRLVVSSDDLQSDIDRVTRLLSPAVRKIRQEAARKKRMNHFKHIALAMHNFHDINKSFPASASYDAAGKPLLSWRVHILPFLDESKLYKQFHLDEPWDSAHNRQLIAKMPSIYADPDSALRKLSRSGRTTFVLPVGPETVFPPHKGILFKEITDGTSNTIMVVEVVPERAVVWTEPADWEVDLDDPWNGVRRDDRDWFTSAFCDGHAGVFDSSLPAKKLRALLTRAGGEVIEW